MTLEIKWCKLQTISVFKYSENIFWGSQKVANFNFTREILEHSFVTIYYTYHDSS